MSISGKIVRPPELGTLSERELQIMMMIVSSQKAEEISAKLSIDQKMVNSYRYRIFKKLGVDSDEALTLFAIRVGIIKKYG